MQFINLFSLLGAILLPGGNFHAVFENVETGKTHVVWQGFAFSGRVKILKVESRRRATLDCQGEKMRVDFWPSRRYEDDRLVSGSDDAAPEQSTPTPPTWEYDSSSEGQVRTDE